jgi:hypothetical protein
VSVHPDRGRKCRTWFISLALSAVAALTMPPAAVLAAPGAPSGSPGDGPAAITGPIPASAAPGDPSHDYTFYATPFDLDRAGYVEQEYFISGTATRYPSNPTAEQQRQAATPIGTMPYTTRIVVRRPAHPVHSAGVGVVDWQNVTAGHDIDTEWGTNADYYVSQGWTWIGASVQRVGVNGATAGATAGLGLVQWSPHRYGSLDLTAGGSILDDSQSFDVFTQVGELAKGRSPGNPLAELGIRHLYAAGASQSARFLGVYYNTVQPLANVYDGFILAIGSSALPPRPEVATKVMRVVTENDLIRGQAQPSLRVPDTASFISWEIAGASHVPAYATGADATDFRATLGGIQEREFGPTPPLDCTNPGPSQIQSWAVFHAAYDALDQWVRFDRRPPASPRVEVLDPTSPATLVRDADGIAAGGIRLPDVEVPIARNDGINSPKSLANPLSGFCVLWGTHRDFTAAQLQAHYRSDADYRRQVIEAILQLQAHRFLLHDDAVTLLQEAVRRHVVE